MELFMVGVELFILCVEFLNVDIFKIVVMVVLIVYFSYLGNMIYFGVFFYFLVGSRF